MSVGDTADFLDANVLVYAYSEHPQRPVAERLLKHPFVISVQGLNEFASVARRKLGRSWPEIDAALRTIRSAASMVVPLDLAVHERGVAIAARHRLAIYDGLMFAAARKAGCSTFWSQDMQDGFVLDDALTIRDPFKTIA